MKHVVALGTRAMCDAPLCEHRKYTGYCPQCVTERVLACEDAEAETREGHEAAHENTQRIKQGDAVVVGRDKAERAIVPWVNALPNGTELEGGFLYLEAGQLHVCVDDDYYSGTVSDDALQGLYDALVRHFR